MQVNAVGSRTQILMFCIRKGQQKQVPGFCSSSLSLPPSGGGGGECVGRNSRRVLSGRRSTLTPEWGPLSLSFSLLFSFSCSVCFTGDVWFWQPGRGRRAFIAVFLPLMKLLRSWWRSMTFFFFGNCIHFFPSITELIVLLSCLRHKNTLKSIPVEVKWTSQALTSIY